MKRYKIVSVIGAPTSSSRTPLPYTVVEDRNGEWIKYEDMVAVKEKIEKEEKFT